MEICRGVVEISASFVSRQLSVVVAKSLRGTTLGAFLFM
jgi:hypothetical protein